MMEEASVRPKRRSKPFRDQTMELQESYEQMDDHDTEVDDLVTEIVQLDIKITEQEQEIRNKKLAIAESKRKAKQKVGALFAELKILLHTKEMGALEELDDKFDTLEGLSSLETNEENARSDKSHIDIMLRNGAERVRTCSMDEVIESLTELRKGVIKRDQILNDDFHHNITINDDITEIFQQWKCVAEDTEGSTNGINVLGDNRDVAYQESISPEPGSQANQLRQVEDAEAINQEETASDTESNDGVTHEDEAEGLVVEGATASSSSDTSIRPSAPPIESPGSLEADQEDPPPYWQAVGLSGPHEVVHPATTSSNIPDLNTRSYQDAAPRYSEVQSSIAVNRQTGHPCNSLENWHSFPSKRQFDPRSTLSIALCWGGGKICLGDRANRKVKFFNASGVLMAETLINGEIHDVCFLEVYNNEARYVISLPRVCSFCILTLKPDLTTKIIKHVVSRSSIQYNCVSRGPKEQTLLCGSGMSTHEPPCVDVISFDGNVLKRFKFTPDFIPFAYPKSVEVYSQFIIISDWKLNTVCVFSSDGIPVGQYSGTPTCPLMDPSDITVDHFGNVMILDGQLPNIHVIDLKCTPIEIIKIPSGPSEASPAKLLAFETKSKMLAMVKKNGQIVIYSFHSGYNSARQGELPEPSEIERNEPVVLPHIEGMLPSTIENIRSRGRPRARTGIYHL